MKVTARSNDTSFVKLGPSSVGVKGLTPGFEDWCHICGSRAQLHAEFFYPRNAEAEKRKSNPETNEYVRMCRECLHVANCLLEAVRHA